jgi:hypothetical protein
MPTVFIGLYLAIWTGVGVIGNSIPAAWLPVLADIFTYAYDLVAYLGLVIVFAMRSRWANPDAGAPAAPTMYQQQPPQATYQQPPVPPALDVQRQQMETPFMPVQGGGQHQLATMYEEPTPGVGYVGQPIVKQPDPVQVNAVA